MFYLFLHSICILYVFIFALCLCLLYVCACIVFVLCFCLYWLYVCIVFVLVGKENSSVPRLRDNPPSHIEVDGLHYYIS